MSPELQGLIIAYLFIFFARVIDMSLDVVRILLLMRGRPLLAAVIGFVEVSIFVVAISEVISGGINDPIKVFAYAGGFATGNYIGSIIEEKMALGYISLQVFPDCSLARKLADLFRSEGFGVTSIMGEGRSGPRPVMFVTIERKDLANALDILDAINPEAFYSVSDARIIRGGVFPPKRKGK
ncbi:MAG TPA: DUF5698 domain-containing protein [Clostridia bacterium]|nr:DUF5698 domain-containing protein [Clostridia bacterium]